MSQSQGIKRTFLLVSGPTAAGKTTVVDQALKVCPSAARLVTTTTRQRRVGEIDGRDYHFTTVQDFRRGIAAGEFLEWEAVHGNLYGSSAVELDRLLSTHFLVIGILDVQGARTVRQKRPGTSSVFIDVGSLREIKGRLEARPGIMADDLKHRLNAAKTELRASVEYDWIIVNRDGHLSEAVERLVKIVRDLMLG